MTDNHKAEIIKVINYLSANASAIAGELNCPKEDVFDIVDLLTELLGDSNG